MHICSRTIRRNIGICNEGTYDDTDCGGYPRHERERCPRENEYTHREEDPDKRNSV